MSKMHNLKVVIHFEIVRMIKKVSFWAVALGIPVMVAAIFGIIFWSNQATVEAAKKLQEQGFSVAIKDESGLITDEMMAALKAQRIDSKDDGINKVKSGELDGFVHLPAELDKNSVEIYGKDVGIFQNSRYAEATKELLSMAAGAKVDPQDKAILQKQVNINTTTYRNGAEYDAVKEMIVPGFFLVLFYMLITFLGNQMLNSTVEEKENRTVEMLLTTVQARTLILGKIIAMVVLAIIQGLVVAAPVLILYLTLGQNLHMPSFDLTGLIFDPVRICVAISVFVTGFMTFTGLLVAIGAIMPTAKEAANWFGIVLITMFGPLYGATAFVSYPESPFVQFLSYFPLTSPIPLLLRNAVGNLQPHEAIIAISILTVSAVVSVLVAVRLFRYGAMQYDSKLSLSVLRARRT